VADCNNRRPPVSRSRIDRADQRGERTLADLSFDAHITCHLSESFTVAGDLPAALRLFEQAVERGFYPHDYIAVHCPFLAPLRGTAEFDRIVARAAERVAAFRA
jgi:hypothetical protein